MDDITQQHCVSSVNFRGDSFVGQFQWSKKTKTNRINYSEVYGHVELARAGKTLHCRSLIIIMFDQIINHAFLREWSSWDSERKTLATNCFHKPGAGTGEGHDSCCCYIRTCDYNPRRESKRMVSLLDQIIILLSNIVTDFYSLLTLETPKRCLTQVYRSSLHAAASQCRFTITQYIVRTKNIADHETYLTDVWFKSVELPVSQNVWS